MALSSRTKKSNIVYLVTEGGTKLCRALLVKRVEVLRPADMNQNWSMDKFLETNKMKILPKLNASSKNIVFPLVKVETNLEKWDVCVFCGVLKEACELKPELKMFLDHLKKIRNKFFHWSDSPIDDNKYDDTIEKLKVIFGKILDELNDDDLRGKINDMLNKVKSGEIPDYELSRILEAIDETNEQVKHAHEDTRNFVGDQHLETRNVIIKGNRGIEEKLNSFIELFTSKFIEQSAKVNENAPEAVGIEIGVRNCGNIEMEKNFSVTMVQLFNDEIRKVPDLSNLPSECHLKLREIIHKLCKSFEEKGYRIQHARQKCILLEIQCTSMIAFMRLFRDYINGSLDLYFNELQTAVQTIDCFKEVCLETMMFEDEFLRTISKIDIYNIQPSQKDETSIDGHISKSENEDCDKGAPDTQSWDEKSNKILLQVIPGTHVEPQELERIIATETRELAQSYGLFFHTKIIGNFEEETQQNPKPATQVSQELNNLPDNENKQPGIATGEGSAKTKVSENFDDIQGGIFEYDSDDYLKDGGVTFKDSENEKGTRKKKRKKKRKRLETKKSVNREKTVYNSKFPSIKEQENILSDLSSKPDCFVADERQSLNYNLHGKSEADISRPHRQQVGLLNNSFEKSVDSHMEKTERGEKTKLTLETNKSSDMVDENEVFKFAVKSLEDQGTPEEIKRKSGLSPALFQGNVYRGVMSKLWKPVTESSVVEQVRFRDETSDLASQKYICESHVFDRICSDFNCRDMHTSTKMPYLWQVNLFGKWTNLHNSEQVEKDYCACNSNTSGILERHNYMNIKVVVMFDKNQKAEVKNLTSGESTMVCYWRRLSTMSYSQGYNINEKFGTQWRWYWKDDGGKWNLFQPDSFQRTLESKFLGKQRVFYFSCEDFRFKFKIDFEAMSQLNIETGKSQALLRRPVFVSLDDVRSGHLGSLDPVVYPKLPKDWVPWDFAHPFELVMLDNNNPDYNTVADSFHTTLRKTEQIINSIYRMQNPNLWSLFCNQEKIMEVNLKRVDCRVATRYLFHGTDSLDAVRAICINNTYRDGAYFARDANYSHSLTKPPARFMFMVKVLVGDKSYRCPPQKPGSNYELFDSCVNVESNPSLFIILDKSQCYPEYLIEYRHVREEFLDETTRASVFHAPERTPNKESPPLGVRNRGSRSNSHQDIVQGENDMNDHGAPPPLPERHDSLMSSRSNNQSESLTTIKELNIKPELMKNLHTNDELSLRMSTSKTTSGEDHNDYKNSGENTDSGNEDDNKDHVDEETNEEDESSDDNSMASDYESFDDDDDNEDTKAKTPELVLRSYQLELAETALLGLNTIVCAETGSGKTWVALHIIKEHLQKATNGPKKVVFMARTSALIKQQFDRFNKYLPQFNSKLITGDDDESRMLNMFLEQEYDILCFTPQILVNNLDSRAIKSLCEFSLLVLDECHHTRGDEPYNRIMRRYLIEKQKGPKRLPQVLGLTAFIGVGKSRTEAEAMDYILKVCASLDVEHISTVERNIVELRKHTNMPEEETIQLKKLPNDPCKNIIIKAMEDTEEMLQENAFLQPELIELITDKHPRNKQSQEYNKWTVDVMKHAEMKVDNHAISRDVSTCAKYLNIYNSALEINKLLPTRDVIKFLAEKHKQESEHKQKLTDMERVLFQNLLAVQKEINRKARDVENPNVRILSDKLRKMINKKREDSRAMVFVKARATCKALAAFLDKDIERIAVKASPLYGKESRGGDDGMTESVQTDILDRFRKGYFKILVCTSMGNEGIDVPYCNIVLSYEYSADEVTQFQMKGRARKHGSTAVVIGSEEVVEQDRTNAFKAAMMYKALAKVNHLDPKVVRRKIAMFQREETNKHQWKVAIEQMKKSRKTDEDYKILCRRCNTLVCYASDVRKMGHDHIVIDTDFADKINREAHSKPKMYDGLHKKYKMFCKKCPLDWGIIGTRDGVECMILKITSFKFLNLRTNGIEVYKKWIDVPYQVPEITPEDQPRLIGETVPEDQTD